MWTIFKVFSKFVTVLLSFYVLVFWPRGMWDLGSLTRDQTCIGMWNLNHWITKEVPFHFFRPTFNHLALIKTLLIRTELASKNINYSCIYMPANAGDAIYVNSIPWSRRSSFQYSSLEKSTDRGTLWATVRGDAKSQTQLSTHTYTLMLLCYCIHHFGFVFVSICFLSFLFCYIVICRLTLVLCLDSVFFFVCIYCR